jgi:hypothetical protein
VLPGDKLRRVRETLGLTLRDVEAASFRLSEIHHNTDYIFPISRLSDMETKSVVPSIFRLYSLGVIYRLSISDLLSIFDVNVDKMAVDFSVIHPTETHKANPSGSDVVRMPVKIDPTFLPSKSSNFGRLIMQWGTVPLAFLEEFETADFTYGYVGTEDFTMYPLLLPGSFVQVDESKTKILESGWRIEYERPIYFVQTRTGYTCSWCDQEGINTTLIAHPLSPVKARTLRSDREVEIIGQVIGVAMRLDWTVQKNPSTTQLLSRPT